MEVSSIPYLPGCDALLIVEFSWWQSSITCCSHGGDRWCPFALVSTLWYFLYLTRASWRIRAWGMCACHYFARVHPNILSLTPVCEVLSLSLCVSDPNSSLIPCSVPYLLNSQCTKCLDPIFVWYYFNYNLLWILFSLFFL